VFTATLVHVLVYNVCQTTHDNVKGKNSPKNRENLSQKLIIRGRFPEAS